MPPADINLRLKGDINYGNGRAEKGTNLFMKFWGKGGTVSYPWKSLDTWFMTENMRWGRYKPDFDVKGLVDKTNRSDLWIAAAKALGVSDHVSGDLRGVETFFDGVKFDPAKPMDYLKTVRIKRAAV